VGIASLIIAVFSMGAALWIYRWTSTVNKDTSEILAKIEAYVEAAYKDTSSIVKDTVGFFLGKSVEPKDTESVDTGGDEAARMTAREREMMMRLEDAMIQISKTNQENSMLRKRIRETEHENLMLNRTLKNMTDRQHTRQSSGD